MVQARLPDINTAFIKHRNEVMGAVKTGNYESAIGSLYALNALLPDTLDPETNVPKYRVVISDLEYQKQAKPKIKLTCYHCTEQSPFEEVTAFDMVLPFFDQQLVHVTTMKAWKCKHCKKVCKMKRTDVTESALKEPVFLGVVPKPPERHSGLAGRTRYNNNMKRWILVMMDELESKMALYRDDHWDKGGEAKDFEDMGIEGGEEQE